MIPSWHLRAACRDQPTELFYPERFDAGGGLEAKRICAGCPVMLECRWWALANHEQHGIWGGMTRKERLRWRRERRAA